MTPSLPLSHGPDRLSGDRLRLGLSFLSLAHQSVKVADDWRGCNRDSHWFIGSFVGHVNTKGSLRPEQDGANQCEVLRGRGLKRFAENEEGTWAKP